MIQMDAHTLSAERAVVEGCLWLLKVSRKGAEWKPIRDKIREIQRVERIRTQMKRLTGLPR